MTSKEKAVKTYSLYEAARDRAELNDFNVSRLCGISPMSISDWKHGKYTPKADKLYKISNLLGIPFDAFMEVTE